MLKHVTSAILIGVVVFGAGIAHAGDAPTSTNPKALVLNFYKLALQDFKPAEAFARYAAPDYVEHNQDTPGGTAQDSVDFIKQLFARFPQSKFEIIRVIAEGDFVFVYARQIPAPAAPQIAIADIFRVHNGKIAEHWDVVSGPPDKVVNPNSRF